MYGKKRIVIGTDGSITRTGGKSHFHIGKYAAEGDRLVARVLRPENKFDARLTDDNSVLIVMPSKTELKRAIAQMWAGELV